MKDFQLVRLDEPAIIAGAREAAQALATRAAILL
jgi:hypothetical protein